MATELNSYLKAINNEKTNKLKSNYIKNGHTVLGVTGNLDISGTDEYYDNLQLSKKLLLKNEDYITQHIIDDAIHINGSSTINPTINKLNISMKINPTTIPVIQFTQAEKDIITEEKGGTVILSLMGNGISFLRKQIYLVYRIGYGDVSSEDGYLSVNANIIHNRGENVYVSEDIWEYQDVRWWSEASRLVYDGPGWYSIKAVNGVYQLNSKWTNADYETAQTNLSSQTTWSLFYRDDFESDIIRDKVLNNLDDILSTVMSFDFAN